MSEIYRGYYIEPRDGRWVVRLSKTDSPENVLVTELTLKDAQEWVDAHLKGKRQRP